MILFRKLKAVVPPVSACTLTTFSATPALATDFSGQILSCKKCQPGCMVWRQSRSPWP